ncbi:bifunctional DNA-formamidopyrimidine glycosylase/DNA-(apurinic or apyrimidinic site) lyase [Emcibacter sp.]|uniref:bifunctional DNA-formamidopyrimidine glycosylase/DNA-(apurinic or apyrimidinic site) lyase n=1 Tax=Emcibacter sp. TaxID=1979954 RepID=UPI002AA8F168|nr:bifunctional DNA-formamidopyrimidine glycosylase/DNA-(apurinic or apyrimidinic site) lyase [Emcibacter sp.]
MPELPEVETVCRGIAPVLEGRVLTGVLQRRPDLRFPFPEKFAERLQGQRVDRISRRAKYILAHLSSGEVLIIHLGMSGRMTLVPAAEKEAQALGKHDHVVFDTDRGDRVVFNDPRRFGLMDLCPEEDLSNHKLFAGMGPEPLGNEFDDLYLSEKFRGRKTPVKNALLDQKVVAGLGNIYVCEALFYAGISPKRQAASVTGKRAARLVPVIRDVLQRAIAAGGSTLKDYARVDGELGYFQHNFAVYGREGEICLKEGCGHEIRRIVQSGRSTFYCPACQG